MRTLFDISLGLRLKSIAHSQDASTIGASKKMIDYSAISTIGINPTKLALTQRRDFAPIALEQDRNNEKREPHNAGDFGSHAQEQWRKTNAKTRRSRSDKNKGITFPFVATF
jgi:hypothetical protein